VDRQSAAATALWIVPGRLWKHSPHTFHAGRIQSGVALRFPPHSKIYVNNRLEGNALETISAMFDALEPAAGN